jgi:hypothetical protein
MMMVRYYQLKEIYRLNSSTYGSLLKSYYPNMQGKAVEGSKLGFSSKTSKENYLQGMKP